MFSSFSDSLGDLRKFRIYLLESYGAIYNVLSESPNLICSEFWYDVLRGTLVGNVRCEDVQNLTLLDESFGIVITQDVFEHIAEPERGLREIWRVLKTGGIIFSPYPSTDLLRNR
jgi:SAM-dependent methyltransferase